MELTPSTIILGDCIAVMRTMPADSVDAIVCDPPYALSFMGRKWDTFRSAKAFERWCRRWAVEALRVAKPGAHLVAFGGTKTAHRLAVGIEDAGWEIRDSVAWLYSEGYPKGRDMSKEIDKLRTDDDRAPLYRFTEWMRRRCAERGVDAADLNEAAGTRSMAQHWLTAAQQPCVPTPASWTLLEPFVGPAPEWVMALIAKRAPQSANWRDREVTGAYAKPAPAQLMRAGFLGVEARQGDGRRDRPVSAEAERWQGWNTALKPAHEPIIVARKPMAGSTAQNVVTHGTGALNIAACRVDGDRWPPNVALDEAAVEALDEVARYFYCPKASSAERDAGVAGGNRFPTVKPVQLLAWLVRLVTPPGGVVLDPFFGTGSTGLAAERAGAGWIGIEREAETVDIARQRLGVCAQVQQHGRKSA